jgi:hypothetical protein
MARKKRRPDDDDAPRRKKKPAPRDDYEDEDDLDELEDDLDEPKKTGGGIYTGMLVVTLLALLTACVFFYLDHAELTAQTIQPPNVTVPALGTAPQPAGKG